MKTILIALFVALSWSVAGQSLQEDQDAGLNGNLEARCRVAWRYATGNGVPANPALVILWGEPAAKAGMTECMSLCGRAYAMQNNDAKALYWFKKGGGEGRRHV